MVVAHILQHSDTQRFDLATAYCPFNPDSSWTEALAIYSVPLIGVRSGVLVGLAVSILQKDLISTIYIDRFQKYRGNILAG